MLRGNNYLFCTLKKLCVHFRITLYMFCVSFGEIHFKPSFVGLVGHLIRKSKNAFVSMIDSVSIRTRIDRGRRLDRSWKIPLTIIMVMTLQNMPQTICLESYCEPYGNRVGKSKIWNFIAFRSVAIRY